MIKSITVINQNGDTLRIPLSDPYSSGFGVMRIDGLGPVRAAVNTTSYATRDGSAFNSARLDNRNIVLELVFLPSPGEMVEDIRQRSYAYFPIKGLVTLIFETDNRLAATAGYVESNEPDIFSERESTQISVICPDPYFYDENAKQKISFIETVQLFHFPFPYAPGVIAMGEIKRLRTRSFRYDGEGSAGIEIMLMFGAETGGRISVTNNTTGVYMVINADNLPDGYKLKPKDRIRIITRQGEKSVRLWKWDADSGKYLTSDILNCVEPGSGWIEAVSGENRISVSADRGGESMECTVTTTIKYEGL